MPDKIDNFAAHHAHIYFRHNKQAVDTCKVLAERAIHNTDTRQQAINGLASEIKRIYRYEGNPLKDDGHDLYRELLTKALVNVDWPGIAEVFIDELMD